MGIVITLDGDSSGLLKELAEANQKIKASESEAAKIGMNSARAMQAQGKALRERASNEMASLRLRRESLKLSKEEALSASKLKSGGGLFGGMGGGMGGFGGLSSLIGGMGMGAMFAAFADGMREAGKASREFYESLKVLSVGKTGAEIGTLANDTLALGNAYGMTAKDAAKFKQELKQSAGGLGEEISGDIGVAAQQLGQLFGQNPTELINPLAQAWAAYGDQLRDVTQLQNGMNALLAESPISEFGNALVDMAPLAKQLGYSFEEIVGFAKATEDATGGVGNSLEALSKLIPKLQEGKLKVNGQTRKLSVSGDISKDVAQFSDLTGQEMVELFGARYAGRGAAIKQSFQQIPSEISGVQGMAGTNVTTGQLLNQLSNPNMRNAETLKQITASSENALVGGGETETARKWNLNYELARRQFRGTMPAFMHGGRVEGIYANVMGGAGTVLPEGLAGGMTTEGKQNIYNEMMRGAVKPGEAAQDYKSMTAQERRAWAISHRARIDEAKLAQARGFRVETGLGIDEARRDLYAGGFDTRGFSNAEIAGMTGQTTGEGAANELLTKLAGGREPVAAAAAAPGGEVYLTGAQEFQKGVAEFNAAVARMENAMKGAQLDRGYAAERMGAESYYSGRNRGLAADQQASRGNTGRYSYEAFARRAGARDTVTEGGV